MSAGNPNEEYLDELAEERKRGLTAHERSLISDEYDGQAQTWGGYLKAMAAEYAAWASTSILVWIILVTLIFGGVAIYAINGFMEVRMNKIDEINNW